MQLHAQPPSQAVEPLRTRPILQLIPAEVALGVGSFRSSEFQGLEDVYFLKVVLEPGRCFGWFHDVYNTTFFSFYKRFRLIFAILADIYRKKGVFIAQERQKWRTFSRVRRSERSV